MAGGGDQQVVTLSVDELRTLLRDVITEIDMEPKMVSIVQKKFEMTLGITDCTDPICRENTRKDMEFTRELRQRGDVKDSLDFIRDMRMAIKNGIDTVSRTIVWAVVVLVITVLGMILRNPTMVDEVLKHK